MRPQKRTRIFSTFLLSAFGCCLSSCDPTYPITIKNSRADTLTIVAEETLAFRTNDSLIDYHESGKPNKLKIITFKIAPGTELDCGTAIAELDNYLPFKTLNIYFRQDSVIARSPKDVIGLFDKNLLGILKKPYCITIK